MMATPETAPLAGLLRALLKQKGWSLPDFNEALGKPRDYTPSRDWISGARSPRPVQLEAIEKLLRKEAPADAPKLLTGPVIAAAKRVGDVLSFTVTAEGEARIRLDIVLPVATATPLLRMLLDAGLVFGDKAE
jgi:hypothetical protein